MGLLPQRNVYPAFFLIFFFAESIREVPPTTIVWAAPAILGAALMITWAAESSQFFIPQGFALAILAWLQTLPEFAVEGILAWHQQVPLLLAGLTGALRLLTGLGWPVIYGTAAIFHRRRTGKPLGAITLDEHHAVEVTGLIFPLIYVAYVAIKGSISVYDGIVLILIYAAYLLILLRLPPEKEESIEELEVIPRAIVTAKPAVRVTSIFSLFAAGGLLIYFSAEPFLASLLAISTAVGIPSFVFIQWVAPLVSEFPEMASTVYFARIAGRAPMALMNMVSSNINQWTLLTAMLPIIYSISLGVATPIPLDGEQEIELWMTLGQALMGLTFLLNMELAWWEATALFALFVAPFAIPSQVRVITILYFAWAAMELVRMIVRRRMPAALSGFCDVWKTHIRGGGKHS
jgi:cation:H+ antiporter